MKISIADDFSDTPWGRVPSDSDFCGENFRENYLVPALKKGPTTVSLDRVEGLGSSFLEEAFGGLVRKGYFSATELETILTIETTEEAFRMYVELIWKHIRNAKRTSS